MTNKLKLFCLTFLCCVLLAAQAVAAPKLSYKLSTPEPQTHYFEVEMRLQDFKGKYIDLKMPVWAPGALIENIGFCVRLSYMKSCGSR